MNKIRDLAPVLYGPAMQGTKAIIVGGGSSVTPYNVAINMGGADPGQGIHEAAWRRGHLKWCLADSREKERYSGRRQCDAG